MEGTSNTAKSSSNASGGAEAEVRVPRSNTNLWFTCDGRHLFVGVHTDLGSAIRLCTSQAGF